MLNIQNTLRDNLAKKKLNSIGIGLLCTKTLENFLGKNIKVKGYLKNQTLFVRTHPSFAKNQVYLQKKEAINQINQKLHSFGYKKEVKEIIIKQ